MKTWILDPAELDRNSADKVGGKAAMLAELLRHDIPIPAFFVVSSETHGQFASRYEGSTGDSASLPEELITEIKDGMSRLFSYNADSTYYAVRSSGVGEDSTALSFAGQFESYLGLRNLSEVIQAVKDCWASARSERLAAYCRSRNVPVLSKFAVIIQEMILADASGVIFTAHPLTGSTEDMLIESNFGLGTSLVQGQATPDRFHITRSGLHVAEKQIGTKRKFATLNPDGGTHTIPTPADQASRPSITDSQASDLAKLAVQIEAIAGVPQDIEWAVYEGRPFILQSRP